MRRGKRVRVSLDRRMGVNPWIAAATLILPALVGFSVLFGYGGNDRVPLIEPTPAPPAPASSLALTPHAPILIHHDSGFTNASGVVWGSGTESDPYVIEDWEINASSADGIRFWDTTAHFIVRNCSIYGGGANYHGVRGERASNGTVVNTICWNNSRGIYFYLSDNNTVMNNTCYDNDECGIRLYSTTRSTVENNVCNNNQWGMIFTDVSNSTMIGNTCNSNGADGFNTQSLDNDTLSDNTCISNGDYGILITYSRNSELTNNTCSLNDGAGIIMDRTTGMNISGCSISNNAVYGVYVWGGNASSANRLWNNTFYHNRASGDIYNPLRVQAYDDGSGNWWNSTDGYGNYWSDWTGPDANGDGIVDSPYSVDGGAGSEDHYPLATAQAPIPEFGAMPFVVIVFLAVALLVRRPSQKKND